MDHGQENTGLPDFSQYNSTSMSSVMPTLSPTTLPAKVVAEVFPISRPSPPVPGRRSTSTAVVSGSDGSGRRYCNFAELSMEFCESPYSRFCAGHDCRTKNLLPLLGDKADVVRFSYWFPFLYMHLNTNISH